MDAPIRFFKPRTLTLVLMFLAVPITAWGSEQGGTSVLNADDMAVIEQNKQVRDNATEALDINDFFPSDSVQHRRDAEKFFADLVRTNPTLKQHLNPGPQEQGPGERYADHHTLLFASFSLERTGLEDMLEVAASDPGIAVVFRGIPDDMEVAQGVMFLQSLATQYDPVPTVVIDPTLFRDYGVAEVPTMVRLGDEGPAPAHAVARVAGLTEPTWLERQIRFGETGDLGVRGPVEAVEERDMIEVMQERIVQIDWAQKREAAAERFWSKQTFQWLPPATRPRSRQIDPRVRVYEDITGPGGEFIAKAGTILNPLDFVSFDQTLIVFNATDEKEMALIAERLPELTAEVSRVQFIATELDTDEGWEAYESVTDYFDAPVYLLTPDIQKRFLLEYTPSVIRSDGEVFIVQELVKGHDDA